jgi:putative ATP-dependent endonuclease of OLD family
MHLSKIEIENFRGLRELTVDLQAGLNVLVGRNNTGKTSLMHAVRHALGASASRTDPIWLSEDDFFCNRVSRTRAQELSVTLTFVGLSAEQRAFFYEIVDFNHENIEKSVAVIRFSASWNAAKRRAQSRRTGGTAAPGAPEVPSEILAAIPVTFLPAMRDAESQLAPGSRSRLAAMLRSIADRRSVSSRPNIEGLFSRANQELEQDPLIVAVRDSLKRTTQSLAGSDYTEAAIRATDIDFDRILRTLQVHMTGEPITGLQANGLGYNNLLYMAVVLEHLQEPLADELPLLMVEEPEAHLHPQLTSLLADYLSAVRPAGLTPQTLVSTHSPTLAAAVPVERMNILFGDNETGDVRASALASLDLTTREAGAVRRMMDVTRASMYFAKGIILVEGVCEALLVPVLAKRLGHNLAKEHIAVIPICGVAFSTFSKLLGPSGLGVRTAIVTDADPPISRESSARWQDAVPEEVNGEFALSARTTKLRGDFEQHANVRVFNSQLTLEYDLAEAGDQNAQRIAEAWERCFERTPSSLNQSMVQGADLTRREKALTVWRGVCLSSSTGSKAELAQHLSEMLDNLAECPEFAVPRYLADAIQFVCPPAASTNDVGVSDVVNASADNTTPTLASQSGADDTHPDD